MPVHRRILTASTVAASALALAVLAPAAEGLPPVVRVTARVSPSRTPIPSGTPLTIALGTSVAHDPLDAVQVLHRADYLFGHGSRFNGSRFPSCSVATIEAAHGNVHGCPKGSVVGHGSATGTAVDLDLTATGRITVFNGPGGRSITMYFKIERPALIKAAFTAPITQLQGRYDFKLSAAIPASLQRVLDSDIVVRGFDVTVGATRKLDGRRRGYFEVLRCPAAGSPVHADLLFGTGVTSSAETSVAC